MCRALLLVLSGLAAFVVAQQRPNISNDFYSEVVMPIMILIGILLAYIHSTDVLERDTCVLLHSRH